MNGDYLWDKSGDDPEVRRVEDALAVFRYRAIPEPVLSAAKPVKVVEPAARWKFSFAFAFAASVAIMIMFGVWLVVSSGLKGSGNELAASSPPRIDPESRSDLVTLQNGYPLEKVANAVRARQHTDRRSAGPRREKAFRKIETKGATMALTSQEKYAYGQLMLALAITGSKLKIVRDTINGTEDGDNAVNENER